MSTFISKLKRRFERDRGVPISLRLRSDALAAARFVTHTASATLALQSCDEVGPWVRTAGGRWRNRRVELRRG